MGKLRFGDFKLGIDDDICYDGLSVTSDDYKKQCRIDTHFGAHALTYKNKDGEDKFAIVLFDDKQEKNRINIKQKDNKNGPSLDD